ncbi:MAG TPA: hypothetical protein VMR06_07745 [Dokdonella sp.]|uniref:hypothetical protein n=1 Tax=Dokdonella sp. TaxID=2291710 RepID=UPI002CBA8635|nr:hypothetical protein [Dokdonella sp.]HUD41880.1 hypothetical protein [Dokdonella sp.]
MPTANAALLARRLEDRRRRRDAWRRPFAIASAAMLAPMLVAAALLAPLAGARGLLDAALAHPERSLGLVALLAGLRALRLRRLWLAERPRSWLGGLPIAPAQAAQADAWRLAGAQLPALAAALAALAVTSVAGGTARGSATLAALIGAGMLAGSVAGALLGRRPAASRASRALRAAAPSRRPRSGWRVLAAWPLRQARAQADPGLHARLFGALLLALPIGSAIADVIGLLLGLAGTLAASECLRGLLAVLGGAGWLRSAALAPRRLAVTLLAPALAAVAGIAAATGGLLGATVAPGAAIAVALGGCLVAGGTALAAWRLHDPTRPVR